MANIYDSIDEDEETLAEEVKSLNDEPKEKDDEKTKEDAPIGDDEQQDSEGDGDEETEKEGSEETESGKDGDAKAPEERKDDTAVKGTEKDVLTDGMTPAQSAAFARQRRELAAANKRAEELAAKSTPQPEKVETKDTDPEPDRAAAYEAWLEWKDRQLEKKVNKIESFVTEQAKREERASITSAAIDELTSINTAYAKENPDYTNAMNYGYDAYYRSIKTLNPAWSDTQIVKEIDGLILNFASETYKKGLNPAEEFYSYAIENLGYSPRKETKNEEKKPVSLKVIEGNKKRSASPLVGGQEGVTKHSLSSLPDMSVGEFANLTSAQLDALEAEARNA